MAQPKFSLLCLLFWLCVCSIAGGTKDQTCSEADETCTAEMQQNPCSDDDKDCGFWASAGECEKNPGYMSASCRKSCGLCSEAEKAHVIKKKLCSDDHEKCEDWAELSECEANPGYMLKSCRLSCGVCVDPDRVVDLGFEQTLESDLYPDITSTSVQEKIQKSEDYMRSTFFRKSLRDLCKNKDPMCTLWSLAGSCQDNSAYMQKHCGPACQTCELLGIEGRCPLDPNAPNAWESGDLDRMFEKLSSEPYLSDYDVHILSSPNTTGGPWIITMENVVSEEEAERLIQLGAKMGYKRSKDIGKVKADGTTQEDISSGRTSTNAWCTGACYKDDKAQDVIQRLSNITGILEVNSEYLQLLKYEVGQKYEVHHDYSSYMLSRQPGVRLLTMYLYLNDVEEGGGTNFDKYNITVMPKRGRVLLWPSVFSSQPNIKDDRTTHQALPVEAGVKYGTNAWFHMRDFKTPLANHCT